MLLYQSTEDPLNLTIKNSGNNLATTLSMSRNGTSGQNTSGLSLNSHLSGGTSSN